MPGSDQDLSVGPKPIATVGPNQVDISTESIRAASATVLIYGAGVARVQGWQPAVALAEAINTVLEIPISSLVPPLI